MDNFTEIFGIQPMIPIVALCFGVGYLLKCIKRLDNKWIPLGCMVAGVVLGIVGMYTMPEFPEQDVISAAALGLVSGAASTGLHQLFKQLGHHKEEIQND